MFIAFTYLELFLEDRASDKELLGQTYGWAHGRLIDKLLYEKIELSIVCLQVVYKNISFILISV